MDAQITPGRTTTLYLDLPETSLVESAYSLTRAGAEIAGDVALGTANDTPGDDNARHSNVVHWASGAITLMPLQNDISNLHEGVVCQPNIISVPEHMTLVTTLQVDAIVAENKFAQSDDLPGFAASDNIQPKGDPFLVKKIPAGGTFANVLADSQLTPDFVTQDIPMDRVGYSNDVYPENQGFFLRWTVPGSDVSVHNYTLAFYFGQYGLCLKGTGMAELWEYCFVSVPGFAQSGGSYQWRRRDTWRYARAGQLSNTAHSMAIWPHSDPNGRRYISFTNNQLEAATLASQFTRTATAYVSPGEHLYNIDQPGRPAEERDESPGTATKAAIVRFDIRRDLKVDVQISTLAWPAAGFLVDLPANVPPFSDPSVPLLCYTDAQVPDGCALTTTLLSSADGSPYLLGETPGPSVRFDFAGDGQTTPLLWEYRLVRDAVTTQAVPGMFPVKVSSVSVSGVSGDASQDTAHASVPDAAAAYPRLRVRGRFSSALVVADDAGKVVLHRGYALRPKSTRLGKNQRTAFPDYDWRNFSLDMAGMAQRLSEKYQGPTLRKYAYDGNAVPGPDGYPPWKVTDVVVDSLLSCGYPPEMINIPDQDIRLWPGETVKADDYILDAAGNFLEYLQRLVRDMLGAYLIFDANAGPAWSNGLPVGQWTLLYQTPYPAAGNKFSPLFSFQTGAADAATPPHVLSAYPPLTAPIFGKIEYEVIPPEFNSVLVTTALSIAGTPLQGAVSSRAYNYASFKAPGAAVAPDPDSPDYLGYERLLIYPDATLTGKNEAETQGACDWVCRRIYDVSCHAQDLAYFTAPLVFITDPAGRYRRPLRFQDPIALNGDAGYLVKACHPKYVKDGFQIAEYEVINPMPGQYLPPGSEISLFREAQAGHARRSTGAQTQSQRFARKALPPHREQQHLELPSLLSYQSPLQAGDGSFYFMPGYDAPGGANLLQ